MAEQDFSGFLTGMARLLAFTSTVVDEFDLWPSGYCAGDAAPQAAIGQQVKGMRCQGRVAQVGEAKEDLFGIQVGLTIFNSWRDVNSAGCRGTFACRCLRKVWRMKASEVVLSSDRFMFAPSL